MASDILITPNKGSAVTNAKIEFTGATSESSTMRIEALPNGALSFIGSSNVGIGTTAPSTVLDVDINRASQTDGIRIKNSNTGGYGHELNFNLYGYAGSTVGSFDVLSMRTQYNGTTGYVTFLTKAQPESTAVQSLFLQGDGSVGIGTSVFSVYSNFVGIQKDQSAPTRLLVNNQTNNASSSSELVVAAYGNSWVMGMGSSAKNSNALTWALDATAGTPSVKMTLNSSAGDLLLASTTAGASSVGALVVQGGISAGNTGSAASYFGGTVRASSVGALGKANDVVTGGSVNDFGIGTYGTATNIIFATGTGYLERARISDTGLAITGALSTTGAATFAGAVTAGAAAFDRLGLNSNPINTVSTAQSFARFQSTGADFYTGTESSTSGGFFPSSTAYAAVLYNSAATPMHFYTSGTLRATISAAGDATFAGAVTATGTGAFGGSGTLSSTYLSRLSVFTAGAGNFSVGGQTNTNNTVVARMTAYNASNANSGNDAATAFMGITSIESVVKTATSNAGGDSGGDLVFLTKGDGGALTERMRLLSTGDVGIGTASPTYHLQVAGTGTQTSVASFRYDTGIIGEVGILSDATGGLLFARDGSGTSNTQINGKTNGHSYFNSGGSVGIGTTTPLGKFQLGPSNAVNTPISDILQLRYYDGNFYGSSAFHYYDSSQVMDKYVIGVSGSGGTITGPNTIAQAKMVIQADGNVGIGTTSPSYKFQVESALAANATFTTNSNMLAMFKNTTSAASAWGGIKLQADEGSGIWFSDESGTNMHGYISTRYTGQMDFATGQDSATAATVKMSILTSGNVGIGTTNPITKLQVALPTQNYASFGNTGYGVADWYGLHVGYLEVNNSLYRKTMIAYEGLTDNAARGNLHLLVNTSNSSASATIADSKLMISGITGNVGIGTTNTDPLSLSRDRNLAIVTTGTNAALTLVGGGAGRIDFGVGSTRTAGIYSDATNYTEIFTTTALPLVFSTNSVQRMLITSAGLVGIGTTSPTGNLEIAKTASGALGANLFLRNNAAVAAGNAVQISMCANSGGDATAPTAKIVLTEASNAYSKLGFFTYAADGVVERLTIANGGDVGIGTSPSYKLDVSGSIRAGSANQTALLVTASGTATTQAAIAIQQLTGEGDTIIFADYEPYAEYGIIARNSLDSIDFTGGTGTGSLDNYSVTNRAGTTRTAHVKARIGLGSGNSFFGGNVGIGTTSTGAKLDVFQAAGPQLRIYGNAVGANDAYIDFGADNAGVDIYGRIGIDVSTGSAGVETGGLFFSTINSGTLSKKVSILGNGNFGVGKTDPTSKLFVKDSTGGNASLTYTASAIATFAGPYTSLSITGQNDSPFGLAIQTRNANESGSAYHLSINPLGGDVGIGTASLPTNKLTIVGSSNQLGIGDGTYRYDISYDNSYLRFKNSAGDTQMVVNWSTGYVGIGTTSPGAKLTVKDGAIHLDKTNGLLYFTTDGAAGSTNSASFIGRADTAGYHVSSGDGGFASLANSFVIGSQSGPLIFATTDAASYPSGRMIIDANGLVGIGIAVPTAPLHVSKAVNGDWVAKFVNTGTNPYGLYVDTSANAGTEYTFAAYTNAGTGLLLRNNGQLGIGTANPGYQLAVSNNGAAGIELGATNGNYGEIYTYNRTSSAYIPLILQGGGGNIGVGTTSPGAKFHVSQALNLTDIDAANQLVQLENTQTDAVGLLTGIRFRGANATNSYNSFLGLSSTGSGATRANFIIATPNTSGNAIERLRIDSSGIATFAGDLSLVGNEKYLTLNSDNTVGSNGRARFRAVGSSSGSGYGGSFVLDTRTPSNNYVTALSIDSSQAATFAGAVITGGRIDVTGGVSGGALTTSHGQIGGTTNGLELIGQGVTNDVTIYNKNGSQVFAVPTGTVNLVFNNGAVSGISTLSATGAVTASAGGLSGLIVGSTAANNGATIQLLGRSSGFNNWMLATSFYVANGNIGLVPSTTVGGSTFSTPVFELTPTGAATFAGAVSDSIGDIRILPQNSRSAAYTTVLSDSGKHILHPSADTTARTITIDSNANVAYAIGTAITFINQNAAGVLTIAITTDTMRLAGAGTTGDRTLAANGVATAVKITSTEWIISGTGLT